MIWRQDDSDLVMQLLGSFAFERGRKRNKEGKEGREEGSKEKWGGEREQENGWMPRVCLTERNDK